MIVCDYEYCSDHTDDHEITGGGVHEDFKAYHEECYKHLMFNEYVNSFERDKKSIKVRVLVEKEVTLDYGWLCYDQHVEADDFSAWSIDERSIEKAILEKAYDFVARGWAYERGDDNGMFWEGDSSAKCEYAGRSEIGTLSNYGEKQVEIV